MSTALTLYEIVDDYQALLDTAEGGVPEEQQDEFYLALLEKDLALKSKVDGAAQFLTYCEQMEQNCDREILRLKALKENFSKTKERFSGYVINIIHAQGKDQKGKWRKLEGNSNVLTIKQGTSYSTAITDEAEVPVQYKKYTISVPAEAWEAFLSNIDIEAAEGIQRLISVEASCDKNAIKDVIKAKMAEVEKALPENTPEAEKEAAIDAARISTIPGAAVIVNKPISLVRK